MPKTNRQTQADRLLARSSEITKASNRHWKSQRDVIRDVMNAANDCNTWLTLHELNALTKYSEASISAQLRHLRHPENGGYLVRKRKRESISDPRREFIYEYRLWSAVAVSSGRAEMREENRAGA